MVSQKNKGFTLIELVAVIGLISVLAALLFPAISRVKERSYDTQTSELCSQVASAWMALQLEHKRFPSTELLKDFAGSGAKLIDGDLCFPMTKKVACVLNWWTPKNPIPKFDKASFDRFIADKKINLDDVETWVPDLILERDAKQKKFGVASPSVLSRYDITKKEGPKDSELVWVMLDTNGDGKVKVPTIDGFSRAEEDGGTGAEINKSVIAWGLSKSKIITSW